MEIQLINLILEIVIIIGGLYLAFFKSYFKEKGKNLATLEDIGKITQKVEVVKIDFNTKIEELKSELQKHNITYQITLSELTKIRFERIDNLYEDLVNLQKFAQENMFSFNDKKDYQLKKKDFMKYYNIAYKSMVKCNLYISKELTQKNINILDNAYSTYSAFNEYYNTDTNKFETISLFSSPNFDLMDKREKKNRVALNNLKNAIMKFSDLLKQLENEFKKQVILKEIE
jgi:hypothetical protein